MIRKLQLKFVVVCMTLVMVVLGVVLVSIFPVSYTHLSREKRPSMSGSRPAKRSLAAI